MPTKRSPRYGSLQYWPRKRADKYLPSVNWKAINSGKKIKGFICYKAGMKSAIAKDNTPDSMTKGKPIALPVTLLECPPMKIFSVRFYKYGIVAHEVLNENLDKELKRKVKLPKKSTKKVDEIKKESYDEITILAYSQVKKTDIKKTPDLIEIGLVGNLDEKLHFVKEHMNKELSVSDFFDKGQLVDVRGLTKGKGLVGPVKRTGISLKSHKSEKGQRRPGSLAPWHPSRVTYFTPLAGQLGMFARIIYNNKVLDIKKANTEMKNLKNYGEIKCDYLIIRGSVQGPNKRQLIVTYPHRPTKEQAKKSFELITLR